MLSLSKHYYFNNIEHYTEVIEENDFFLQYTNEELPNYRTSNYLQLKYSPTLPEFQLIEKLHVDYQHSIKQNHLKIIWLENVGMYVDILDYLNKESYKIGKQELLIAEADNLHINAINNNLEIEVVSLKNFDLFLKLNYKENMKISQKHAETMQDVYRYQFSQPHVEFILALINKIPVGAITLVYSHQCLELDNVLTDSDYRKQRIASTLIHYAVDECNPQKKPIILVADAEDSPQDMYKKMGFTAISYQISAEKELF